MSNLIRSRKAVTTAQSSPLPAQPAAAIAPAQMDHLLVGLGVSHAPVSSASSVAQPVSARCRHRPPSTTDTTSTSATSVSGSQPAKKNTRGLCRQLKTANVTRVTNSHINIVYDERHRAAPTADQHSSLAHDIGHVVRTHCPMKWKSWKVMPDEMRTEVREQLSTNYNLEDLDDESLAYVNRLFVERYKQWKCDLHHHFQAFDDPQVALQEGCPKELEGREDSWAWLCGHFQEPDYVKKAKANKGNRDKKTLLHHSGSRPFSYRMEARRRVTRRRPGTYCRGMGNVRRREPRTPSSSQSNSQVIALRAEVAELKTQLTLFGTQMSQFLESLARSGIPIPHFGPSSTSKPLQPKHGHNTSTPVDNVRTSEPHLQDDHVDF